MAPIDLSHNEGEGAGWQGWASTNLWSQTVEDAMTHAGHHHATHSRGSVGGASTEAEGPYLKAALSDRLAPFYDLTVRLAMRERHIKRRVIDLAELAAGQALLDVGCGTGTLALMARQLHPTVRVVGVDGDPVILRLARRKAEHTAADVRFDEAMAYALPYEERSFDAVVSTLAFHHLTLDQMDRTLSEVRRVLRPGGRLVVADFAAPHNVLMAVSAGIFTRLVRLHGDRHAAPHGKAAEPFERHLTAAGWTRIAPPEHFMTLVGTLAVTCALRPVED
jgi:ubiquinone/menaquinone biosynthesis C-methylase UbiE